MYIQIFNKKINNSGITLISLIVTIIILLILSSISISMLTGNNRYFKQNKTCKANDRTKLSL